jgi:predicted NBD/HSP70 family sugar kinase
MSQALAIDIGGTKIEAVLFDDKYRQLRNKRVFFRKSESDAEVRIPRREVLKLIGDLISEIKGDNEISGIGVSIPDIITPDGSILGKSKIRALDNFPLARWLRKRAKCEVIVRNDADCFALGEFIRGGGRGHLDLVGVIWGTGIGAGIVCGGRLFLGACGSAGEFGHNPIDPNGPLCRCGLRGCVEAFAGGPNMVKNFLAYGGTMTDPTSKKIFSSNSAIAKKVIGEAVDAMGKGLAQLTNILSIQYIVLGGGISNANIYSQLTRSVKKYTRDALRNRIKVVKNKLGDSAGVYGAAYLVFSKAVRPRE